MKLNLTGKVALVTGGGKGIGKSISKQLANEGTSLIIIGRDQKRIVDLVDQLNSKIGLKRHKAIPCDLMEPEDLKKLLKFFKKNYFPDIIVHNVGGSLGISNPLAPKKDWEKVWNLNLGNSIEINNAVIPNMIKEKWGRIVHISTISTITFDGNPAYVCSKSALNAYVKNLSRVYAKYNIIISAVAPGAIHVENKFYAKMLKKDPSFLNEYYDNHLAIGRLGNADEISPFVTLLCSDLASFASGCIIPVDGGTW